MDTHWQSEFRKRMQKFGGEKMVGFEPFSIKIRVSSGCFHREHSPRAYQIIDQYFAKADFSDVRLHIEEHESGPEILVYLAVAAAGLGFAKSVVELVTAIIKARSEGIKRGDDRCYPLELIVRGHNQDGKYFEQKVLEIPHQQSVTVKQIEDALLNRNVEKPADQISFELWLDEPALAELEPFLDAEGVIMTKRIERMTRSLTPSQVTALIVGLSGFGAAVAAAFGKYFQHTGKRFTASTRNGKIECHNFTEDEIRRLISEASMLILQKSKKAQKTKKPRKSKKPKK